MLEFRETALFTRAITAMLTDAEYAELQTSLVLDPEAGDLIQGTGGLRKLRWQQSKRGKGKRGGVRVIYYWHASGPLVYMLLAYSKGEKTISLKQRSECCGNWSERNSNEEATF